MVGAAASGGADFGAVRVATYPMPAIATTLRCARYSGSDWRLRQLEVGQFGDGLEVDVSLRIAKDVKAIRSYSLPGVLVTVYGETPWVTVAWLLYLGWPLMYAWMKHYQYGYVAYGDQASSNALTVPGFFSIYVRGSLLATSIVIVAFLAGVVAMPLGALMPVQSAAVAIGLIVGGGMALMAYVLLGPYQQVRVMNLCLRHTSFPGVRLVSNLSARDFARLHGDARRHQAREPAARGRGALLVDHVLQRVGEIGLQEAVADLRHLAARQEDRAVRGPRTIAALVLLDHGRHVLEHGEALARVADGRPRHIAEGHRAVVAQRGDPGIGRGGHDGAQDAQRHLAAMLAHEEIGREALGPVAEARDGDDLARRLRLRAEANHDRRHARDVHLIGMQDRERDARRAARVDRVAVRVLLGHADVVENGAGSRGLLGCGRRGGTQEQNGGESCKRHATFIRPRYVHEVTTLLRSCNETACRYLSTCRSGM